MKKQKKYRVLYRGIQTWGDDGILSHIPGYSIVEIREQNGEIEMYTSPPTYLHEISEATWAYKVFRVAESALMGYYEKQNQGNGVK